MKTQGHPTQTNRPGAVAPTPPEGEGVLLINLPAKARILVVDDDTQLLKLIQAFMDREGHLVYAVGDGEQAMALAAESTFDLLITDLIMPVKEGLETIIGFQKRYPRTRIIAMSGGGTCVSAGNYLGIARSLGGVRTLVKPFSKEELLASVSLELAASRQAHKAIRDGGAADPV